MKQPTRPQIKEAYNITDVKPIYTLIVDGNSLFKRSISVDKRLSSNGIEYGAIFQFLLQVPDSQDPPHTQDRRSCSI